MNHQNLIVVIFVLMKNFFRSMKKSDKAKWEAEEARLADTDAKKRKELADYAKRIILLIFRS